MWSISAVVLVVCLLVRPADSQELRQQSADNVYDGLNNRFEANQFLSSPRQITLDTADFVFPTSVLDVEIFDQEWNFSSDGINPNSDPMATSQLYVGQTSAGTEEIYLSQNIQGDLAGFIRAAEYDYVFSRGDQPYTVKVVEQAKADYKDEVDFAAPERFSPSPGGSDGQPLMNLVDGLLSLPGNLISSLLPTAEDTSSDPNGRRLQTSTPTIYILYSQTAADAECPGTSGSARQACVQNAANVIISSLNTATSSSNVDMTFSVPLVDIVPNSDYTADGFDSDTQLDELTETTAMMQYRQTRVDNAYDFLAIVVENMSDACGVAYRTTNGAFAYQVTERSCIPNFTFSHETGHNMDLQHNREEVNNPDPGINYGYTDSGNNFRSIMGLNCPPQNDCGRVNRFSSPNLSEGGQPLGINGQADAVTYLNSMRTTYEGYGNVAMAGPIFGTPTPPANPPPTPPTPPTPTPPTPTPPTPTPPTPTLPTPTPPTPTPPTPTPPAPTPPPPTPPPPTPAPPTGGICLSGQTLVQAKDTGSLRLDQLQVGDSILTQDGSYSLVYSFGDFSRSDSTTFLQLWAQGLKDPVEISADHMLYVTKAGHADVDLLPASEVEIGDSLIQADGSQRMIQRILSIRMRGFYHPLTVAGNMIVNDGVVVSNYVSREWVPQWISPTVLAWLQHGGHAPVRWYCTMKNGCDDEGRTEATGFSASVQFWYRIEQWALSLPWLVQWMLALTFAPFLAFVTLVGFWTSGSSGVAALSTQWSKPGNLLLWAFLLVTSATFWVSRRQSRSTQWTIRRTKIKAP